MKRYFKETTIGKNRFRVVRCTNCGKIFNAYQNGKISGILMYCNEIGCMNKGTIESVDKETAMEFIKDFYRQEGKLNHRMEMIIEEAMSREIVPKQPVKKEA